MATSRSRGGRWLTTRSPILISPLEMSSRPAIMRKVVDLPQPEGPTRATNSLSAISRSDRKSTRLNSSHANISYAVFCLKKKKEDLQVQHRVAYRWIPDSAERLLRRCL